MNNNSRLWTNGYCSVFAYALNQRFGLPMWAILEVTQKDKHALLLHAVGRQGDIVWDANGSHTIPDLFHTYNLGNEQFKKWAVHGWYYNDEASKFYFVRISKKRLNEIHDDFDLSYIGAAYTYIEQHQELFAELPHQKR